MKPFLMCLVLCASICAAMAGGLPNKSLTPGLADPALTEAVICNPHWSTKSVRNVSAAAKRKAYAEYHITSRKPGEYEIDHLISLELGGSNDLKNLWPQSYITKPWNAHVKDKLENRLHVEVCGGHLDLKSAQMRISDDWIATYLTYFDDPK